MLQRTIQKMHFKSSIARGLLSFHMPSEDAPQARTLMAWPSLYSVNDKTDALKGSRQEVAAIANAISRFEPVTLYAPKDDVCDAIEAVNNTNVTVTALDVDNLWMRDTGPVYVVSSTTGELAGVEFNFNDWGEKDYPNRSVDWSTAHRIMKKDRTREIETDISIEGGAIEVDGEGTLMATESSILNSNRNPGLSKADIEGELTRTLGIKKFIWFKGVKGKDVTDDHVDGLARFVAPGIVLLSRPAAGTPEEWMETYNDAKRVLQTSADAQGRHFEIHEIEEAAEMDFPEQDGDDEDPPALNYVNYLVVNGGVVIPRFGDKRADAAAKATIEGFFQDREVVQVDIRWIAAGGGGIHCATQQVPLI
jgi:agmatine deiminase